MQHIRNSVFYQWPKNNAVDHDNKTVVFMIMNTIIIVGFVGGY